MATDDADEPVPRLPRSRGLKLSRPQLIRIAGTAMLLVLLIVIQRPCADTMSTFVTGFGDDPSATKTMPRPGTVDQPASQAGSADDYEKLPEHMTQAEFNALVERQKQKQAAKQAAQQAGSATGSADSATGSAAP